MWRVGKQAGHLQSGSLRPGLHAGQREGSAPPADVRSAPGTQSPVVHSLGTQLFANPAAEPSGSARVFLRSQDVGGHRTGSVGSPVGEENERKFLVVRIQEGTGLLYGVAQGVHCTAADGAFSTMESHQAQPVRHSHITRTSWLLGETEGI